MPVPDAVADRLTGVAIPAYLATSVDDRPHVAPLLYRAEDGHLQVLTGGRKLANVRENPRVAVPVESTGEDGWLLVLRGPATVIENDGDPDGALADIRVGSATLRTD